MYGLANAQREWHQTVSTFLKSIGGVTIVRDQAVYLWHGDDGLFGFLATHVDDFFWAGGEGFEERVVVKLRRRFPIGEEACGDLLYVGVHVVSKHGEDRHLEAVQVGQEDFVEELNLIVENKGVKQEAALDSTDHTAYRGAVGSLLWASSTTRPDMAFDVALLSGSTSSPTMRDLVLSNKTVKRAKRTKVTLNYPRLRRPVCLVAYCDAAWANLWLGESSPASQRTREAVGERSLHRSVGQLSA